jgi:NitT/TauT family transport system substrate-binding protein
MLRLGKIEILAASLVLWTAFNVSSANAQTAPGSLTPVSINLSWVPTTANQLPFFLAKARGYFVAEGLDVTLVPGRGSSLTAQTVGAGKYEIAQADLATMAVVRSKGAPLKAFMVQFPRTSSGIIAAKDAGIEHWKDLAGKTLGVTHGGAETYLLPAVFKKLGLDLNQVKLASTPAANKNTAYMSKLVQGISTDVASELPLLDPIRPLTPLWYGEVLDVPYHGLFTREDTMQSKPEVIRGVAAAVVKATKEMATNQKAVEDAAVALAAVNPAGTLETANLVAAWKLYAGFQTSPLTEGQPIGSMSAVGWQKTLEILREYAAFQGSMDPNDYFTNSFLPK